tara:strand:+ start:355 stop:1809 length:1455 start_codon:yes stop_codon:yes gene_type:complete
MKNNKVRSESTKKMSKKLLEPGLPRGFEDSFGKSLIIEKKIKEIIEKNFLRYGYAEIKTSPFEYSENIGGFLTDDLNDFSKDIFTFDDKDKKISLRFDLSAPLARVVSEKYLEFAFPFRRFQIAEVFRNETSKTGRGRYRSFFQGDFDQIFFGKVPPQANAEILQIICDTMFDLKFKKDQFKINIFNRKIIEGLLNDLKIKDEGQRFKVLRAIDKYERINENFIDLLQKERVDPVSGDKITGANLSNDQVKLIIEFLKLKDLKDLKLECKNELQKEGITELEEIFEILNDNKYLDQVQVDSSKIRGLNYYDSVTFETTINFKVKNKQNKLVELGSVASGGSYAKLCSRFKGGANFEGTGCSFGISRITYLLLQLDQLKTDQTLPVIVCTMNKEYFSYANKIASILRKNNINTEIYSDPNKNLGKMLSFANKKGNLVACIIGNDEFKDQTITLKNLMAKKGEDNQVTVPQKDLINEIRKIIPKNN